MNNFAWIGNLLCMDITKIRELLADIDANKNDYDAGLRSLLEVRLEMIKREETIDLFIKPESKAVYQALIILGNRVYIDDNLFSKYEYALIGAFRGKPMTRAMIRNDESVELWIRKKYIDSNEYISARTSRSGEIVDIRSSSNE